MAASPDITVYPASLGRAPLQGGGVATIDAQETVGLHIDGANITVFSVRLWTQYAEKVIVKLMSSKGTYPAVDVSYTF